MFMECKVNESLLLAPWAPARGIGTGREEGREAAPAGPDFFFPSDPGPAQTLAAYRFAAQALGLQDPGSGEQ